MSLDMFDVIYRDLILLNKQQRVAMPGMMEWRAEMIVVTCTLLKFVLNIHTFSELRVSRYSLKEGVLFG
jgi:exopolyphosphatase / guanosine-5'-triphosphate,3'-diphosphate pyrophosphatase